MSGKIFFGWTICIRMCDSSGQNLEKMEGLSCKHYTYNKEYTLMLIMASNDFPLSQFFFPRVRDSAVTASPHSWNWRLMNQVNLYFLWNNIKTKTMRNQRKNQSQFFQCNSLFINCASVWHIGVVHTKCAHLSYVLIRSHSIWQNYSGHLYAFLYFDPLFIDILTDLNIPLPHYYTFSFWTNQKFFYFIFVSLYCFTSFAF